MAKKIVKRPGENSEEQTFKLSPSEILESISDAFYAVDADWHLTYINHRSEEWWHRRREELLGSVLWDMFPEPEKTVGWQMQHRAMLERIPVHWETFSVNFKVWVDANAYPTSDGGIVVYFHDITKGNLSEEALHEAHDNLEHRLQERTTELQQANEMLKSEIKGRKLSEDKQAAELIEHKRIEEETLASERGMLRVTIDSIQEGVLAFDLEARILFINETAARLIGYNQNEAFGQPVEKVFHVIDDKTSEPILMTDNQMASKNPLLVTRDLREIPISLNRSSILTSDGRMIGTVLVFQDITVKQKIEQEMLKTAKLESLGILAGGVAHDFNNILAGILANLQLIMVKLKKHQDISNQMNTTIEITRKASDLTKQLLTFAKGGDPVKKSSSIASLTMNTVQFALSGSKVKAEFHLPEDLWTVDIDGGQINQVINNLTINAEQAMPTGGILEIYGENVVVETAGQYNPGRYVKLTVKDHGIGIPSTIIDKIFDPFFTTKKTGNGLGLSTSYSIIKKHDGYLEVESAPGIGTTFYILLPTSLKELTWTESETEIAASGEAKILLMDDEDAVRNVGGEILFYYGYQVTLARDGREAVELYKEAMATGESFDMVIMDLTVPGGLGGIETMAILRQIDPDIKAVISSGYASDPVMADYEKYGFQGVVTKPYVMEELVAVLNKVLDRKQLPLDLTF